MVLTISQCVFRRALGQTSYLFLVLGIPHGGFTHCFPGLISAPLMLLGGSFFSNVSSDAGGQPVSSCAAAGLSGASCDSTGTAPAVPARLPCRCGGVARHAWFDRAVLMRLREGHAQGGGCRPRHSPRPLGAVTLPDGALGLTGQFAVRPCQPNGAWHPTWGSCGFPR